MLVEVVVTLHHAEGSVKRQWLLDAMEISCVSRFPSTVEIHQSYVRREKESKDLCLIIEFGIVLAVSPYKHLYPAGTEIYWSAVCYQLQIYACSDCGPTDNS